MNEADHNYIVGSEDDDGLVYARSIETFFICISCNNAVRTDISHGWGISEHIPMKSLDTSHICITRCARCCTSILIRGTNGRIRSVLPSAPPRISPRALRTRSQYQEIEAMCIRIPELICWSHNGDERVAYVNIRLVEEHHFNAADVICVRGEADVVGKIDMNFFVVSRYL